jgi:hypothetical protein
MNKSDNGRWNRKEYRRSKDWRKIIMRKMRKYSIMI